MPGRPVVLLGQGEQYDDPDDWRELMRGRRIRRGVELPVRRDGLTALVRPEDVPELAAVLDVVDPPGPPSQAVTAGERPVAAVPPTLGPLRPPSGPGSPSGAPTPAAAALPPTGRALPTAARRGRRLGFGVRLGLLGLGVLLLVRLCSRDGFGGLPAFGDAAGRSSAPAERRTSTGAPSACAHPRGWIAQASCDDPDLARLRPALGRAYAARASGLGADERSALGAEQARWQASRAACRSARAPGPCLERLYRARIAELGEARAPASAPVSAEPPAVSEASQDAAQPRGSPLIDRPEWVRRPSGDEVADAYPERALRLDLDGRARLACRVTAAGALTACDILSEDPPEYGFGGAALRLSRYFQMRPVAPDGRPVEGARVEVPVAFAGG